MPYCAGCGKELPGEVKFCPRCGVATGSTGVVGVALSQTQANLTPGPLGQTFGDKVARYALAIALGLPVAILAGIDAGLMVGGGETGGSANTMVFLSTWAAVAFYASRTSPSRRVFGRTCILYSVAAFLLPISAIIFSIVVGSRLVGAEQDSLGQAGVAIGVGLAGTIILVISFVFGLFTGTIGVILGYFSLRTR
jgi:hypothetical protein